MTRTALLMCLALFAPAALPDDAAEEIAVMAVLHAACKAYLIGDAGFLERVLDERFTLTDPSGVVTTKTDELAAVRKRDPAYEVFENSAMKVRLHDDAAVVTGITKVKGVAAGAEFHTELQFTDVLVREDGAWVIAASHVSPLKR